MEDIKFINDLRELNKVCIFNVGLINKISLLNLPKTEGPFKINVINSHCTFFVHIFGQETLKKRLSTKKNIYTFIQALLRD